MPDRPTKKSDLRQGRRGKPAVGQNAQLSREQLVDMTPEQIEAARAAGQLDTLLGIQR